MSINARLALMLLKGLVYDNNVQNVEEEEEQLSQDVVIIYCNQWQLKDFVKYQSPGQLD